MGSLSNRKKPHQKQPVIGAANPLAAKRPAVGKLDRRNYMGSNPSWRFQEVDHDGPHGWDKITRKDLEGVISSLKDFEKQTWSAIFVAAKYQHHSVPLAAMIPEARKRLVQLQIDDIDELHRLRLSNRCRVWGIFREGTFAILWWDPEHEICPSKGPNN